jgi:hypothetical protein
MLQGLFRRAENKLDSVVAKYVGRVTTAIPLLIASGFATAALTVKLVEIYGTVAACSLMAALFAVIGLITMAVVETDTSASATNGASAETASAEQKEASQNQTEASDMLPSELLTPEVRAFLSSAAPMALPSIARGIGRNLPLLLILALIGFVISRFAETPDSAAETATGGGGTGGGGGEMPNGMAAAPPAA